MTHSKDEKYHMCDEDIDFDPAPPIFYICLHTREITHREGLRKSILNFILPNLQDDYLWRKMGDKYVRLPETDKAFETSKYNLS